MYLHRLTAGLDEQGNLIAWQHRIVGQSVLGDDPSWIVDGVDITSVAGASNIPYDIPNILVDLHTPTPGIPVDQWRSVGDSHTAFSVETFLDDVAHAAGKDPYQLRLELLSKDPRSKAILQLTAPAPMRPSLFAKFPRDRQVMQLAAEKAGWGRPLPPGKGRGLAVHYSFHASLAYVAEVTVASDGSVKVDRVVCAVDCGIAINPDVIRAQVEGGVAFGLGAILYQRSHPEAGQSRTIELQRLSRVAHERDAEDRGVHCELCGAALGNRRAHRASHRPGGLQRNFCRHGKTRAHIAAELCDLGLKAIVARSRLSVLLFSQDGSDYAKSRANTICAGRLGARISFLHGGSAGGRYRRA